MTATGSQNPNWKGGLTKFRTADELLSLEESVRLEVRKRLLAKYELDSETGCWNWTGAVFKNNGRASIALGKNRHLAARLIYVLERGPTGGLCVLHSCDNGLCINPEHLWLGTFADNSADMVRKNRSAKGDRNGSRLYPERLMRGDAHYIRNHPEVVQGENNGRAKLTEDQVREIRLKYEPPSENRRFSNRRELAAKYRVSPEAITLIVGWKTWRGVL